MTIQHHNRYTLIPNFDGSVDTAFQNGDKPVAGPTVSVDLVAFAALIPGASMSLPQGTPVSYNFKSCLLGLAAEVYAATLSLVTVSGSSATANGWTTSGSNLAADGTGNGTGILDVVATDRFGNPVNFPQVAWNYFVQSGVDVLPPTVPTGVIGGSSPTSSVPLSFDSSADNFDGNITPSSMDHYNIYVNTVKATPPSPFVAPNKGAIGTKLTAANIGGGTAGAAQTGTRWNLSSTGSGVHNTAAEQLSFVGTPLTGDQAMALQVESLTGPAAAGIMVRESSAQGAVFASIYVAAGAIQAEVRTVTGQASASVATIPAVATNLRLRCDRAGSVFSLLYSTDGKQWNVLATPTVSMAQAPTWGGFAASWTAGQACSAIVKELNLSVKPAVSTSVTLAVQSNLMVTAVDKLGNESVPSIFVLGTPNLVTPRMGWFPGVHYSMYQFGGSGSSVSVVQAEMLRIANANASRLVKGFEVNKLYSDIFPTIQGDWANSKGIAFLVSLFQYAATLPNGPYQISMALNAVGNTYAPASNITDAMARSYAPSWWYNNANFGPVGGNAHGGVYWDTTNGMTLLWWNTACLNDIIQCLGAIYAALESQGYHLYRVDVCMEMSRAPVMIAAGETDANLIATWGGSTGFAKGLRDACPKMLLNCKPTFTPSLGANMQTFLGILTSNKWSPGNYDNCNETTPSDLTAAQGHPRAYWGDLGFRGQQTVGGAVTNTNYKALGFDFHVFMGADELGNRPTYTNPVPPANIGDGRIPDSLIHAQQMNASHFYIASERHQGPLCNTLGSYGSQPANYRYPATGAVVTAQNSIDYLVALNANSYLNLNYPSAF